MIALNAHIPLIRQPETHDKQDTKGKLSHAMPVMYCDGLTSCPWMHAPGRSGLMLCIRHSVAIISI